MDTTIKDVAEVMLPGGMKGCSADDCKDLGNKMLQSGKVADAVWLYSLGLEKRPGCHVLHSNRSAAHARVGEWAKALADADECVSHNPAWARGYSRRASALEGLGKLDEAIAAHEKVLDIEANNTASQQAIEALNEKKMQKKGGEDDAYKGSGGVQPESAVDETMEGGETGADAEKEAKEAEERAKARAEKITRYKDRGNKAIQAGNFEDAIDNYSTAIELDPNNHVLYSNRAAAYSSVNQFQSALKDAQKCINLAPKFAKGYGRKAAALCGLNKRAEAIATYHQGLALCGEDAGLQKGLNDLAPPPPPKAEGPQGAEGEGAAGATQEGGQAAEEGATEEDQAAAAKKREEEEAKAAKAKLPEASAEEMAMLSEFLSMTSSLERNQAVERIMKYKLNPFEVLRCSPEMTPDEINQGYRKISLSVHPDKCKHPRAEEAFETCKKALAELQDEQKRAFYVEMMDAARLEAERELKKKKKEQREKAKTNKKVTAKDVNALRNAFLGGGKPVKRKTDEEAEDAGFGKAGDEEFTQEDKDTLEEMKRDAANRILQQLEKRRAHAEKVFIENEKRSKLALEKLRQEAKVDEKHEKDWDQDRTDRIDSWREFATGGKKLAGIKKPKPSVTEHGVSVLPPTMGGFKKTKEEQALGEFLDSDLNTGGA